MNSNFINEISLKVFQIEECKSHLEFHSFFKLMNLYGLIESREISNLETLFNSKFHFLKSFAYPVGIFILSRYFQSKTLYLLFFASTAYISYEYRKIDKLTKSTIFDLGNKYKERVNKFKKTRDFRTLNPNFVEEKINFKELNLLQYSYKI